MKKEIITPIDMSEAFREEAEADLQRKQAEQHPPLLRTLGLAYYWQSLIDDGRFESFSAIAAAEGMSKGRISRIMQLCRLSPERVQGLMETPGSARLKTVLRLDIPLSWEQQGD